MLNEKCPACSAPLIESTLVFSDGSGSPLQIRCSNVSCGGDCHRHPEKLAEYRQYLSGAVERARVAVEKAKPKVESSSAVAASEDVKPPKPTGKRR